MGLRMIMRMLKCVKGLLLVCQCLTSNANHSSLTIMLSGKKGIQTPSQVSSSTQVPGWETRKN